MKQLGWFWIIQRLLNQVNFISKSKTQPKFSAQLFLSTKEWISVPSEFCFFCKLLKQMIHCSMYTCIMCTWTFKNVGTFSSYKFWKASHISKLIWTISTKKIYSNCWYIMMHNYFWQTSSYVLTHPLYIFCPFNLPESFKIWNIKVWQGSLSALSFLSSHLFLSHFLQFSCC